MLPFERLLRAAFGPNAGRNSSLDHVNQLFEKIALRQRWPLRRDFARIRITTPSGAEQVNKGTESSLRFHGPAATVVKSSMASPL